MLRPISGHHPRPWPHHYISTRPVTNTITLPHHYVGDRLLRWRLLIQGDTQHPNASHPSNGRVLSSYTPATSLNPTTQPWLSAEKTFPQLNRQCVGILHNSRYIYTHLPQLEKDLAVKRSSLARTPTTIPLPPSISTIQKIDNKLDPLVSVTCLIGLQIKPGRDIDSVIKDK